MPVYQIIINEYLIILLGSSGKTHGISFINISRLASQVEPFFKLFDGFFRNQIGFCKCSMFLMIGFPHFC